MWFIKVIHFKPRRLSHPLALLASVSVYSLHNRLFGVNADTLKRFQKFAFHLAENLNGSAPLFKDRYSNGSFLTF